MPFCWGCSSCLSDKKHLLGSRLIFYRDDPIRTCPSSPEADKQPEPEESIDTAKLDPASYCRCGHCSKMDTMEESFCCQAKTKQGNPGRLILIIFFSLIFPALIFFVGTCLTLAEEFKQITIPFVLEINLK